MLKKACELCHALSFNNRAKGSIPKAFAFANKRQRRHSVFTNGSLAYKDNIKI
jgi:hypothetical protein